MNLTDFAREYGYNSHEEFMENSYTVIFDGCFTWFATITRDGWLAWVNKRPGQPLGIFQTYTLASIFIHAVFNEIENEKNEAVEVLQLLN